LSKNFSHFYHVQLPAELPFSFFNASQPRKVVNSKV